MRWAAISLLAAFVAPSAPVAFGGQVPDPAPSEASGERLEAEIVPLGGERPALRLYLADRDTNAPVDATAATLTIPDRGITLVGSPVPGAKGVWEFRIGPASTGGRFAALLAVATADRGRDLLVFGGVEIPGTGPAPPGRLAAIARASGPFLAVASIVLLSVGVLRGRRARRGASILVAAGLLGSLRADAHPPEKARTPPSGARPAGRVTLGKEAQFALSIRTQVVALETLGGRRTFPARLFARPDGKAEVIVPVAGRVVPAGDRLVRVGDRVRKGEPLVVVESTLSLPERVAGTNELLAAEVRLQGAADEMKAAALERERLGRPETSASDAERSAADARFERARASFDAARPAVEQLRASLRSAPGDEARVFRDVLSSAVDGVVTRAAVTIGERAPQGKVLYTIVEPSRLWVSAEIYEGDFAAAVAGGFLAGARATVSRRDAPRKVFAARFVAHSHSVDPATATTSAVFEVENPTGELLEGMLVDLHLRGAGGAKGLAVPEAAVVDSAGTPAVFLHTLPTEFVLRPVVLGASDGERVEVRSGLAAGDRVVVSGAGALRVALSKAD